MAVPDQTVTTRTSLANVYAILNGLPQLMQGAYGRPVQQFLVRIGLTVQTTLHDAFLQKSAGGTDLAGLRWKKLHPLTIKKKKKTAPQNAYAILREHDHLLRSLTPALRPENASPTPPTVPLQVFRLGPGTVEIGTSREHALANHEGRPPRLPARRLWPRPGQWPAAWWQKMLAEARMGVMDLLQSLLSQMP